MFFEAINAAGVMQIPYAISIWDDEYGISVSKRTNYKTKYFRGFKRVPKDRFDEGFEIICVKGWIICSRAKHMNTPQELQDYIMFLFWFM